MLVQMLESFFQDIRLILVVVVICVVILWHNLKILGNVLVSTAFGKKKHILVTGCDSGFGYEIALILNKANCKVFAGCLTEKGVEKFKNLKGFEGIPFILDVRKDEDVEKARKLVEENIEKNGLYAVVNNAGIGLFGLIEWNTMDQMQDVMNVNFLGMVRVTKAMLPMLKIGKGRIINISSMSGRLSTPMIGIYAASKFAMEAFSDSLRNEVNHWGVSVHIIEPTMYKTDIIKNEAMIRDLIGSFERQSDETKNMYKESFPKFIKETIAFKNKIASPNIDEVIEKVKHAVFSSNPKTRYSVGSMSFVVKIVSMLPTSITDWIINKRYPALKPDNNTFVN